MHTHKRLSQTHLSRPVDVSVPIYICNAHRKSPYQAAHVSESMRTHPRSDGVAEIGGPLSLALTNGDEDKHLGLIYTREKLNYASSPLPLSAQQFSPCLFSPLAVHPQTRRLMGTQRRLVYLPAAAAAQRKTAQSAVMQCTENIHEAHTHNMKVNTGTLTVQSY